MRDLIRDTACGQLIRLISGNKFLKFPEEEDPSIWTRFIDEKKSGYLAHHGDTEPPEDGAEMEGLGGVRTRENQYAFYTPPRLFSLERTASYNSRAGSVRINEASGIKVDSEKGRDIHLVTWWGDSDPENVLCIPQKCLPSKLTMQM